MTCAAAPHDLSHIHILTVTGLCNAQLATTYSELFDSRTFQIFSSGYQQPLISMTAPLHDAAQQLGWLLGTWESQKAEGFYPSIQPFNYKETLEFSHIGQPMLNFSASSSTPENKPLHRESGFLRVNVGTNHVAYISAQNIGVVEIEEGKVNGNEISLESTGVHSTSFGKEPKTTKIARTFKLIDDSTLEQTVSMATSKNPDLAPHLNVTYKKVN